MDLNDLLQMGATVFRDSNLSGAAGSSLDIDAITSTQKELTDAVLVDNISPLAFKAILS